MVSKPLPSFHPAIPSRNLIWWAPVGLSYDEPRPDFRAAGPGRSFSGRPHPGFLMADPSHAFMRRALCGHYTAGPSRALSQCAPVSFLWRPGQALRRLAPASFHTAGTGESLSRCQSDPSCAFIRRAQGRFSYVEPSRAMERMRTDLGKEKGVKDPFLQALYLGSYP